MIDIHLSINNREQVIKLPILPSEFKIKSHHKNETYDTISQGEIKLIGMEGLKSISIESFFPHEKYDFARDYKYRSWDYVEIIEEWKKRRVPIRIVISNTPINMACTIDSFEYGIKDGTKDIYYTLELGEFKFINLNKKEV